MDIANRVKTLREDRNYSIYKLAKLSDVSSTYLREIELAKKQPTVEIISRICKALGITLADFFSESSPNLSPELYQLLHEIKDLTPKQMKKLKEFIKAIKE